MAFNAYNPLLVTIDVTQAGGLVSATITRPLRVIDVTAYVTVAAATATSVQVSSTVGNITDSIGLGNNNPGRVGRAATLDSARTDLAAWTNLQATQGGAGTSSRVTISAIAI